MAITSSQNEIGRSRSPLREKTNRDQSPAYQQYKSYQSNFQPQSSFQKSNERRGYNQEEFSPAGRN